MTKRPSMRRLPTRLARRALHAVLAIAATAALASPPGPAPADGLPALSTAMVAARDSSANTPYEGVVEALRQTVVAAQVPGAVIAIQVRAGDKARAGEVLMRIDARAAEQTAAAGAAQARAARAAMDMATRDFERQQQLFSQGYISHAALDHADARFKTSQAEAAAQLASAGAARIQSGFYVVKAPYGGVVASVSVVLGDMAMPGRPLLTLYDPSALRVTAAIPQTAAERLGGPLAPQAEIPGAVAGLIKPVQVQLMPTVDAASHTLELRMDLPANTDAAPGMFARAWLPGAGSGAADARLFVPSQSLVRRPEFAAVYVIGKDGKPLLRQVRPGRSEGSQIEILSGVTAGERVALDPQAAARIR
ncbi:efflux RND transporter periplasmic adaptor subunit [Variovorax sp. J22R133]|uniref:efflux RND transporter periplasmic adaptor subunit n=1 Tax=Variovorax brevis TaxID=3053503 RepID=UPI0025780C6A|nr:efflux RND transporter periplasmic adaptor subunit [Variovorax sp. J22R133]MDM0114768.1 efflux RND transporter periplasmic adaptor subunit [Variovorax sp. J22R133]